MNTDNQFVELILVCANALVRNKHSISIRNIMILYNTFLRCRFESRNLRELTEDEFSQLLAALRRWEHDSNKLRLVVDNTKDV